MSVSLPARTNIPMTIIGNINPGVTGVMAQTQLVTSVPSNFSIVGQNNSPVSIINTGTISSATTTFVLGSSVNIVAGTVNNPVFTPTTQPYTTGSVAVSWAFTYTVTAGNSPVYIPATPSSAVTLLGTPGPVISAINITGGPQFAGDTNTGIGTGATGSFIVPANQSRIFTINVLIDNSRDTINVPNAQAQISGIYFELASTPSGSITSTSTSALWMTNLSTFQSPIASLITNGTSTGQIIASIDPSSPLSQVVQTQVNAITSNVPLAIYDIISTSGTSTLRDLKFTVVSTGTIAGLAATSSSYVFDSLQIQAGNQTSYGIPWTDGTVTFYPNITLPAGQNVSLKIIGNVSRGVTGVSTQIQLVTSVASNFNITGQNNVSIPVTNVGTISSATTTFMLSSSTVPQVVLSLDTASPLTSTKIYNDQANHRYVQLPVITFDTNNTTQTTYYIRSLDIGFRTTGTLGTAYLYNGSNLVASVPVNQTFQNAIFGVAQGNQGWTLPANRSNSYTIRVDVTGTTGVPDQISAYIGYNAVDLRDINGNGVANVVGSAIGNTITLVDATTTGTTPPIGTTTPPVATTTPPTGTTTPPVATSTHALSATAPVQTVSSPTVTLTAIPSGTMFSGQSVKLVWSSTNATACSGTQVGGNIPSGLNGSMPTSGTIITGPIYSTTNYTIACKGAGGIGTKSITVKIAPPVGGGGSSASVPMTSQKNAPTPSYSPAPSSSPSPSSSPVVPSGSPAPIAPEASVSTIPGSSSFVASIVAAILGIFGR